MLLSIIFKRRSQRVNYFVIDWADLT
jgi:hypothetical protein